MLHSAQDVNCVINRVHTDSPKFGDCHIKYRTAGYPTLIYVCCFFVFQSGILILDTTNAVKKKLMHGQMTYAEKGLPIQQCTRHDGTRKNEVYLSLENELFRYYGTNSPFEFLTS